MPKIAEQLPRISIIRSVRSWALLHPLAFGWSLISRNPSTELGAIAPHIGSVVAREFAPLAGSDSVNNTLPTFVRLNADDTSYGAGYFSSDLGPFNISSTSGNGLDDATHGAESEQHFLSRYDLIKKLEYDGTSPRGQRAEELTSFRAQTLKLMFNSQVNAAFSFTAEDHTRYGGTGFGDSCLVARNLLKAKLGARFIHITSGAGGQWDQHANIYTDPKGGIIPLSGELDNGLGNLLADLQRGGLLDETLVVWLGEFGRTVRQLNDEGGRDHHLQQFACFAGGGVRGGRILGATNPAGDEVVEYGWSGNEYVRFEHVASTIYSALGIDHTKILWDDPTGRGFEYVPGAAQGGYPPVLELF
jgi:hypothetical protein